MIIYPGPTNRPTIKSIWAGKEVRKLVLEEIETSSQAASEEFQPRLGTGLNPVTGLLQAIVDIHKEGTLVIVALYLSSFAPQTYLGYFMCSTLPSKHWLFASYLGSAPQHLGV